MLDIGTVQTWIEQMGYGAKTTGPTTLRVHPPPEEADLPPFFIQCSENWVLLSILPALGPPEELVDELARQLLFANRDMRIVKFALGKSNDIILCAELPTESLSFPEFGDAVQRLVGYCKHYRSCLKRKR